MPILPNISATTLAKAKELWSDAIVQYGRQVGYKSNDGLRQKVLNAFCKRPKILGQFDRTEQSYDQEKYMVIIRAEDMEVAPVKYDTFEWDDEDHAVLSVTEVELQGTLFGYRVLVKG